MSVSSLLPTCPPDDPPPESEPEHEPQHPLTDRRAAAGTLGVPLVSGDDAPEALTAPEYVEVARLRLPVSVTRMSEVTAGLSKDYPERSLSMRDIGGWLVVEYEA